MTLEPHLCLLPRALDPIHDINLSMQLINLAPDIRNLARKIHLIAQDFSGQRIRAQRVHRAGHHGRVLLLVVEDGEGGGGHGG